MLGLSPGPGSTGGLQPGDVITHANGQRVRTASDLDAIIDGSAPGDVLELEVIREGGSVTVRVTVGERPVRVGEASRLARLRSAMPVAAQRGAGRGGGWRTVDAVRVPASPCALQTGCHGFERAAQPDLESVPGAFHVKDLPALRPPAVELGYRLLAIVLVEALGPILNLGHGHSSIAATTVWPRQPFLRRGEPIRRK